MANLTLVCRDSYLDHIKPGVKLDTFSALRNGPLNTHALFPDAVIRKAEDEIAQFESLKRTNQPGPGRGGFAGNQKRQQNRYQPYSTHWKQGQEASQTGGATGKDMLAWKSFGGRSRVRGRGRGGQPGHGTRPPKEQGQYKWQLLFNKSGAGGPASERCNKCQKTKLFCVCSTTCIVSCCQSCTFCLKCERAVTKERRKSLIKNETRNKFCEKRFFCRSLSFFPKCSQCPQCCKCPTSGRSSPRVWAKMVPPRCESKGTVHTERRVHSPIQTQTSERTSDSQWLCKPTQEPLPEGSFACPDSQEDSREGKGSNHSSLFQQVVHCPQTKSKMAANLRPRCSKQIFERKNIQDGDPRDNSNLFATKGVGDIAGFQRRLFLHSGTLPVQEIPLVSLPKPYLPVSGSSLWPLNSSYGVHLCGQRGQINGSITGYKDPPVKPRRLVDLSPHQRILPPGHPVPPRPLPGIGAGSEPPKISCSSLWATGTTNTDWSNRPRTVGNHFRRK